jgi:Ca2+-binding RTX toxin-like protein
MKEDTMAIENGGPGVDQLFGTSGKDQQNGAGGNDVIYLSPGADKIDGGTGFDTVWGNVFAATTGIEVDLRSGFGADGVADDDEYQSIENFIGTRFADLLSGSNFDDQLSGSDGDDEIFGNGGDDLLSGIGGGFNDDGSSDILWGGDGNDDLIGGRGKDKLTGGNGDDILEGGRGGDRMDGRSGLDTVDYTGSPGPVIVELADGKGGLGDAEGDKLKSIEVVFGSDFSDKLIGNLGKDSLFGAGGNDVLKGESGSDFLSGGDGRDKLSGGTHKDFFSFDPGDDKVVLVDFKKNVDIIDLEGWQFDSSEEVSALATNAQKGVVLDFGGGDKLLVKGAKVKDLDDDVFLL